MLEKKSFQIILVLSLFIVCLFLTLPAHQANKWGLYSQEVKLQGTSGRYLQGQARELTVNKFVINNVSWDFQELSILLGRLALKWEIDDRNIQGQGLAAQGFFGSTSISDANVILNTEVLSSYLPKGNTIAGEVELNLEMLSFQEQLNNISASAKADELSIQTVLGFFKIEHINLEATGNNNDGFHLVLTDFINENAVNVVADIKQGKVVMSGHLSAQSDLAKQLKSILPLIAKKKGNDWLVSWKGNLPKV